MYAAGVAAYLADVSRLIIVPWLVVAAYIAFTVMHDGMHRTGHHLRWANDGMARVAALLLLISLPLFRAVHHAHHGHTNDPEKDPDLIVARQPRWALPLWCLAVLFSYSTHFYGRRLWRNRAELVEAAAIETFWLAVVIGAYLTDTLGAVLTLWIGPAFLALLLLAFAFDFLPHYPFSSRERYYDTRIYPGRFWNVLLLGQNYHLIHHLWTTVPWYRYQQIYAEIEPELRERGCPIGWSSRAETKAE